MKLFTTFALASLAALGLFSLGILFQLDAASTCAYAAVGLLILGLVRDYSPRPRRWEPRSSAIQSFAPAESPRSTPLKLAA